MIQRFRLVLLFAGIWAPTTCLAELPSFHSQELARDLGVGYAVSVTDLAGDGRPDIVVVDQRRVLWFENPGRADETWPMRLLISDQTRPDNVAIAPYDVDDDGRLDLALGADWRPFDTKTGGTIQWLKAPGEIRQRWSVIPIGEEPMVHRLRWADLDGDGRAELIVAPLMGRNTTPPHFAEQPVRILAYKIPADPARDAWTPEVISEDLHVTHNFWPTDFDGDGRPEILIVSFEGVHLLKRDAAGRWTRARLGAGNQQTSPNRGASEIKDGRLADGSRYIATIEPWHGFQVVVYTPPPADAPAETLWTRHVLDEELKWGHAVWCANLDDDADEELIVGVRDNLDDAHKSGVRIYDPQDAAAGRWSRTLLEPGAVAVEDLALADLDADGRPEIVAAGRATHNLRVYWNDGANSAR